ncbi:MAG TPA: ATP-dependent helicase HrpB [Stellaceae bacterium]|nr:ATP-dependent helicase HrpB [Stellaceae bacterium]
MNFDLDRWRAELPIGAALPEVLAALDAGGAAVLEAPPGAGKTTLVPLALGDARWLGGGRILMLEPRRLAARAAAARMAAMLGEAVGETVGYRTRLDSRVGPRTRIEVLTEGILLRVIADDPALEGTGLVIFDEFHERSLDADLGLALTLDLRRHLRADLRILVMSATLDGVAVARLLGDAPVVASAGRSYDVAVRHLARPAPDRIETAVADCVRRALADDSGGILVFLPGGREIRRVERILRADGLAAEVILAPLYGDLPQAAQDAAIHPAPPGRRKIVLATSIAETSLTIDGIGVVIDGGLMRVPRFHPSSGMTRLETVRVSQASAEQRRGRAGRLGPGVCYRLWPAAEQAQLAPFNTPEIRAADLAPLALMLAQWGERDPAALSWLDPPPAAAFAEARALLARLDALDDAGGLTAHGRAMAALGLSPRLAHMVLRGKAWGMGALACAIAALLSERDLARSMPGASDADLRLRVECLDRATQHALPPGLAIDRGALDRARRTAALFARQIGLRGAASGAPGETGRLLAQAYPDRIAQRRSGGNGQFRLANGSGAFVPPADPLAHEEFLAVADLDGDRRNARIFLAAPLSRAAIASDFAAVIETADTIAWDAREEAVLARRQRRLGTIVLDDAALADAPAERIAAGLIDGIRSLGLGVLPWQGEAERLRQRILFLRRFEGAAGAWPDLSDQALLATLADWLGPSLAGLTRRAQLRGLDLAGALGTLLDPAQRRALERLAPTHVAVPSGSRIAIDYGAGEVPVLAVRLQEMFGANETPTVAGGRVPLVLHLLSPAGRPLQVTRDLGAFWDNSYPEVRRSMRGRYPRHPWPENPREAAPTARAKPRGRTATGR